MMCAQTSLLCTAQTLFDKLMDGAEIELRERLHLDKDTPAPPELLAACVTATALLYLAERNDHERLSEAVEKVAVEIAAGAGSIASEMGYLYGLIEGGRNG